jgi:hypothetical protein
MNFNNLSGKIFSENELYELLLFDIENNLNSYSGLNVHIYYDRVENQKIKVTEVIYFSNITESHKQARAVTGKREWFEIAENEEHSNLYLTRLDKTGKSSSIFEEFTNTDESTRGWPDESANHKPMTEEEIRQGFRELAGMFEEPQYSQISRPKKAV